MPQKTIASCAATLRSVLSFDEINALGLATGQSRRLRVVTPARLLTSLLGALGGGSVESIADLCREFNFQQGTTTAYKAFYNRLAHEGFPRFMKAVVERLLGGLAVRSLAPAAGSPLERFEDIVLHDGSSFALKASLQTAFPGRFTPKEPAAVELHVTFSGFHDEVMQVQLAPDKEAERQFLPPARALSGKLLLADRGYPSVRYLRELRAAGASWVMRLSRAYKPWVVAVHGDDGSVESFPEPITLAELLNQRAGTPMDLDVEFRTARGEVLRVVLLPGKDKWMTWLCTDLPRDRFPPSAIGRLYRFRWQIELLFKEWKSYANLHAFDTSNEFIAEGLIWASLAAAILKRFVAHAAQEVTGAPISTRKVAMCAQLFLRALCASLAGGRRNLRRLLREIVAYLAGNATRANPAKERRRGRLTPGLVAVGVK
jgi:hypothetical protein